MNRTRTDRLVRRCITGCAAASMAILIGIAGYLAFSGLPALGEIGWREFLFGRRWDPSHRLYGILPMLISSLLSSALAALLAWSVALPAALFALCLAPRPLAALMQAVSGLLSGLPSVIFGLLGMIWVVPAAARLFPQQTAESGGASLLAVWIVLAAMLLPQLFLSCMQALQSTEPALWEASAALGASPLQSAAGLLPASRQARRRSGILAMQRAIGESMAVLLVSGNVAQMPRLFSSIRTLAAGMVLEMGYASGLHRQALFAAGMALLLIAPGLGLLLRTPEDRRR